MSITFTDATFGASNYSAGVFLLGDYTGTSILSVDNVTSVTFSGTLTTPGETSAGTLTLNTTGAPIVATNVTYDGFISPTDSSGDPVYIMTATVAGIGTVAFAISTDPGGLPSLSLATPVNTTAITAPGSTNPNPPCFASGTLIRTVDGDVAVEQLKVGDLVITASGARRPIAWLGHHKMKAGGEGLGAARPIRVSWGAFGDRLPEQDLYLSPGHSVCVSVLDQVLIPIEKLVNGATIARTDPEEVTYWHVELESHDILLANGLPAESYIDVGNRGWLEGRFGRIRPVDDDSPLPRVATLADYARPFVDDMPGVGAVRERLDARAKALGWRVDRDLDMRLDVDGERIEPEVDGDLALFVFPATARSVRLVSKTFQPSWRGEHEDGRDLGVCVTAINIGDGLRHSLAVSLDHLALSGFDLAERQAGSAWRWTDGDLKLGAELWEGFHGHVLLRVSLGHQAGARWIAPAAEGQKREPALRVA